MLLTRWDGRTTIFGNSKHGRGNEHYAHATKGYWQELSWLCFRNPVNNLCAKTLAASFSPYIVEGDETVGDKTHGGSYAIRMGWAWEYYCVIPYGKRCFRARIGWKISGKKPGDLCEFVFVINPWKSYSGLYL